MTTPAYSEQTNTTYDSWDELVEAEASGYVIVAKHTSTKAEFWVRVYGPFKNKDIAKIHAARLRRRYKKWIKREPWRPNNFLGLSIVPCWSEVESPTQEGDQP